MKYFLIGFAVWFFLAFGTQFIKAWIMELRFKRAKKHAKRSKKWMYEL